MSSSDESEEEFLLAKYGTPMAELEDTEIQKKPIAVHEQIVTDEQGRRRFHGAFTGGFSAGYYNTVDTPEGWVPTSFRSSRSDRKGNKSYVPEDFMDEEDLSEYGIAPKRIVPQKDFSTSKDPDQNNLKRKSNFAKNATMLLGLDMLQSLVIPVSNNVGVRLLQKMGWKPGQGVGPKVKRPKKSNQFMPENVEFAPTDCVPMEFNPKVNSFGLGYTGMDPKRALHDKVKKSSAIAIRTNTGAKLSFAGQAFGVGAYEDEDQDIYAQDSMANYDLSINDEKTDESYGWSKPTKAITGGVVNQAIMDVQKVLDNFKKAEKSARRKTYAPPILPPDYDPFKRAKIFDKYGNGNSGTMLTPEEEREKKFERLGPGEHGEMLGEKRSEPAEEFREDDSIFKLLKPRDRERLQILKHGGVGQPLPPKQPKKSGFYEPFASNPEKQERYDKYVKLLKNKDSDPYSKIEHDANMTEWELQQEREEFAKSSRFFQPLSATMSSRFATESETLKQQDAKEEAQKKAVKMKMFGIITRDVYEWHPDRLLCKRFNVPNPYPHSDIVGVPGNSENLQTELFLHPDDIKHKPGLKAPDTGSTKLTGVVSDTKNPPLLNRITNKPSRWDEKAKEQLALPNISKTDEAEQHLVTPSGGDTLAPPSGENLKLYLEKSNTTVPPSGENATLRSDTGDIVSPEPSSGEKDDESSSDDDDNDEKPTRPSMDIFKAIFQNSDSSSDSEDEEITTRSTKNKGKQEKMDITTAKEPKNEAEKESNESTIASDVNNPRFHKFSLPKKKNEQKEQTDVMQQKKNTEKGDITDASQHPSGDDNTIGEIENSSSAVQPTNIGASNVNHPNFHKFAPPNKKNRENKEAIGVDEGSSDVGMNQFQITKDHSPEMANEESKEANNVNQPLFHKFQSRKERTTVKRTNSPEATHEAQSVGSVLSPGDTFGPSLPPVKVPKMWDSTEPESLKVKKSKKSKHKKHKHKKKKK